MIFSLIQDFADALAAMPREHPRYYILKLLDEAIRRDVHFIDRHPTTLFQCMWNTSWWYDCPEAERHYDPPSEGWTNIPPWQRQGARLHELLGSWRTIRSRFSDGQPWLRALGRPNMPF